MNMDRRLCLHIGEDTIGIWRSPKVKQSVVLPLTLRKEVKQNMIKTELTAKEIRQLEKQLNFAHQDIYSNENLTN